MKKKIDESHKNKTDIQDTASMGKQAEEKIRESEKLYKAIFENTGTATIIISEDKTISLANAEFEKLTGYTKEEAENKKKWTDFIVKEDLEKMTTQDHLRRNYPDTALRSYEFRLINKAGETKNVLLFVDVISGTKQTVASLMDITERKQAEENLSQSEEKYRSILENIREAYFEVDLAGNFTFFNESLCRLTGCSREELTGTNYIKFSDEENTKNIFITFNKVYKTGDLAEGFDWPVIRKDGSKGYVEASVLLRKDSAGNPIGFRGVLHDITERKRAEEKLQQIIENLRQAVGTTIQVMVSAVEMRDPYTAGHLIRSADIARAIATEMRLDQNKIDGIRVAGSIHDIGKLAIPAEILSRPTKLTTLEFSLIKEHSKSGYDMLKDVESPWPLAEIVYQHHERMDGTGYPRNLKGDEIILEARILAVADVVEAMASHRPHRASLGFEAALEEIENNKGILYDAVVADACLKLFREKGYQLIQDGGKQAYRKHASEG